KDHRFARVRRAARRATPAPQPIATKPSNRLFLLGIAGISGLTGLATYFIWPRSQTGNRFAAGQMEGAPIINQRTPPGPAPEGMVWVPGGAFWMGGEVVTFNGVVAEDSLPMHKVVLDGFWMDQHELTNEKWSQFAKETGYLMIA